MIYRAPCALALGSFAKPTPCSSLDQGIRILVQELALTLNQRTDDWVRPPGDVRVRRFG